MRSLRGLLQEVARHLAFILDVLFAPALLHFEQRRLRDVNVPALDQFHHLPIEEREQQRSDVRTVDVGVGHDDDLVIAELRDVEVVHADARTERGDHRRNFGVGEHLVVSGLLDVENLSLDRKNRLRAAIAALFRRSACRISFDDEDLRKLRRTFLAIGQLAGQGHAVERALSADELARTPGGLARARSFEGLSDDPLGEPPEFLPGSGQGRR